MHEYRIVRTLSNALSNASRDFDKKAAWFEDRRREVAERERQTEKLAPLPAPTVEEAKPSTANIADDWSYRYDESYLQQYGRKTYGKRFD